MVPSPPLALIIPRQLLSALFTIHFRLHALQIIILKIGHSDCNCLQYSNYSNYSNYFSPAKHPKHCFDSNIQCNDITVQESIQSENEMGFLLQSLKEQQQSGIVRKITVCHLFLSFIEPVYNGLKKSSITSKCA